MGERGRHAAFANESNRSSLPKNTVPTVCTPTGTALCLLRTFFLARLIKDLSPTNRLQAHRDEMKYYLTPNVR